MASRFILGVREAGKYLGYVYLPERYNGFHLETLNWAEALGVLAGIQFDKIMTLESMVAVDKDIASGLAIWRPVAENPDDVLDKGIPFILKTSAEAKLKID